MQVASAIALGLACASLPFLHYGLIGGHAREHDPPTAVRIVDGAPGSTPAVAGIGKRIDRTCRELETSLERLASLGGDRALKETFTVGGRAIKGSLRRSPSPARDAPRDLAR